MPANEFPHTAKVAILIVNGGHAPQDDRWIRLCLERIAALTEYPAYHIYLWNNRIGDPALETWLLAQPHLTLLSAASYEKLHHPHRTPLQRLYHLARQEGATVIVALDSDAHPLRSGWLKELLAALDSGAAIAGVWRAEMAPAIRAHVHPSCLCTTVAFIEQYHLRFDFDNTHSQAPTDTLAHFTWVAEANGLPIHRLLRTNRRQFHYWMGGVYGDLIYHHGAASREHVVFHNSDKDTRQSDRHRYLRDSAADFLFNDYEAYFGWLQGRSVDPAFARKIEQFQRAIEPVRNLSGWWRRWRSGYLKIGGHQRIRAQVNIVLRRYESLRKRAVRWSKPIRHLFHRMTRRPDEQLTYNPVLQSFQKENLAPLASYGWTVGPPDFVGVGAPKSGTTWWYKLLIEHPQIVHNRVRPPNPLMKETQYFLHFQYGELSAEALNLYREAFAAPPGAVCGEFSTQYLGYPTCLEHLAVAAPDARIIVMLRNPIDRFFSHLNHLMTKRVPNFFGNLNSQQHYLFTTYSLYTEATLASLYSIGLTRLFQYFHRDQVLVLQYERLVQSPEAELARTYRFLGVDERFRAQDIRRSVNQGEYLRAKPDAAERSRLAAYYRADVLRTVALCPEIDLMLWPDFVDV